MDRALIIKKPWIDLILSGQKTWEMRSRPTNLTGWIGLIEQGSGLIVGKALLTGCIYDLSMMDFMRNHDKHMVDDLRLLAKWKYPWVLEQAKRFENPIPYTHPRGAVIWVNLNKQ